MYIEFNLPDYEYGSAGYALAELKQSVAQWSADNQIEYRIKPVKGRIRLTFNNDSYYSLFLLTWRPRNPYLEFWHDFRLITDLNHRT